MAKAKDFFSTAGGFVASMLGGGGLEQSANNSQGKVAAKLLTKSPLELSRIDKVEDAKADPLAFSTIQYPSDLTSEELGHYIIFYMVTNNSEAATLADGTKLGDFQANRDLAFAEDVSIDQEGGGRASIAELRSKTGTPPVSLTNTVTTAIPAGQKTTGAIAIYMPPGITTSYKNTYDIEETSLAGDILKTGKGLAAAESVKDSFDAIVSGVTGAGTQKIKELLSGALDAFGGGDVFRLFSKNVGLAINPRNEQFYVGPGFRSFSYTFQFYPKNQTETDNIQKIIKLFKYHAHPILDDSVYNGRMFVVPSEFEIHYMFKESHNPYLHKISRCVLSDVEVKYGPEEQMSSFGDGAPTQYELSLTFTEQEFQTKSTIARGM